MYVFVSTVTSNLVGLQYKAEDHTEKNDKANTFSQSVIHHQSHHLAVCALQQHPTKPLFQQKED
jgi:hypothetical protein